MTRVCNGFLNALTLVFLLALASLASGRAPVSANQSANESQLPQPQGFVNDFAGKLNADTKQKLESLLAKFADRSGIELAVVIIPFENMEGQTVEEYSLRLGKQWGIGRGPEKLGLLLLVAIKPPDDKGLFGGGTRLEVSRNLERDMPNELAREIIRKMRDDLKSGRFDQALTAGVQDIISALAQKRGFSMKK